jgi:hypothetical protein
LARRARRPAPSSTGSRACTHCEGFVFGSCWKIHIFLVPNRLRQ